MPIYSHGRPLGAARGSILDPAHDRAFLLLSDLLDHLISEGEQHGRNFEAVKGRLDRLHAGLPRGPEGTTPPIG